MTAGPGSVNAREARGTAAGPRAGKVGSRTRAAEGWAIPCRAAPRQPDAGGTWVLGVPGGLSGESWG